MASATQGNILKAHIRGYILTRIRHIAFAALAVFSLSSLSACSSSPGGASEEQIANTLAIELEPGVEVEDVEVKATDSLGTEVDPRFRTRSTVTVVYEEDFYRQNGRIDGKPLVKKVAEKGDTVTGSLVTVATPRGEDNWRIQIERLDMPPLEGKAASQFGEGKFVVEDSKEHAALTKKLADEEAKEKAEQEQKVADLSRKLAGTWSSNQPLTKDGAVYAYRGYQTGFELTLNPADGNVGTGTAKMYVFSQPEESKTTNVGYVIDESGDFATITFNGNNYHRVLRTDVGRNMRWRLNADGQMTATSYRSVWIAQLKKRS